MLVHCIQTKRQQTSAVVKYWKVLNESNWLVSPVPFNALAHAALCAQASSASVENLSIDLGQREGSQSTSIHSKTLAMTEMIRCFVVKELRETRLGLNQSSVLKRQLLNSLYNTLLVVSKMRKLLGCAAVQNA
eukprot:gb/GEZJ01009937.1/.p1 GENE.gb/GEZJ01009937.1/~~gb/GEZJ01009937.1/.p1  ORF type:complete len:133 (-),score=15.68 gb/GEZJ01009937.1/:116-514(-)